MLSSDFGGIELGGDIVLPDAASLDWHTAHAAEGDRLTTRRLGETTRAPIVEVPGRRG